MSVPLPENLDALLEATSRSFYKTMRVLPRAIRPQISLAYLLARTTDTIADTEILPVAQRLEALKTLREKILGQNSAPLNFSQLALSQGSAAEKLLLEKTSESLALLETLSPDDLKRVRAVLVTITSGQELDLERFGSETTPALTPALSPEERENAKNAAANHSLSDSSQRGNEKLPLLGERVGVRADSPIKIIPLQTAAELDDYTYRVAGCVGEFWTQMCRAHLFPDADLDEKQFFADGIRFGKGLQMVNILRDLPADLKNGRCYLPLETLSAAGLAPENMLTPANEKKFLPVFHGYLDQAEAHLAAGWRYTNTLPFGQFRVRLACAWPVLIGQRTIAKLRAAGVADLRARVKISRRDVRNIILLSLLASPLPFAWRKLFFCGAKAVASGPDLA
jgi:farnesyl-diphosphate farnesyltransferase